MERELARDLASSGVFARLASTRSQASPSISIEDFMKAKEHRVKAQLNINRGTYTCLKATKYRQVYGNVVLNDVMKDVEKDIDKDEIELITLRRQKKVIVDDIHETLSQYETMEKAYSVALSTKGMCASGKTGKRARRRSKQSSFNREVLSYYGASKKYPSGMGVEKYCHLTGWQHASTVKSVHLVPEILQSEDLAYLLGVREISLSEPRNGITLNYIFKEALDCGWIVFIPDPPKDREDTVWRCVLVNHTMSSRLIGQNIRLKDLDGQPLKFLTKNRPAKRYLYLRYICTFLHWQRLGNADAVMMLGAMKRFWEGAYLRKSMLDLLASRVVDDYLPDIFDDGATFTGVVGSPPRSHEEEGDLAIGFDQKLKRSFQLAEDAAAESERDSSSEDSDNESYESD